MLSDVADFSKYDCYSCEQQNALPGLVLPILLLISPYFKPFIKKDDGK